jgi:hypothetical protein
MEPKSQSHDTQLHQAFTSAVAFQSVKGVEIEQLDLDGK